MENHRVFRRRPVAYVAGVIQAHGQDFPRRHRGQQPDLGEGMGVVGELERRSKDAAVNGGDILAVHDAVMFGAVSGVAGNPHNLAASENRGVGMI